MPLPYRLFATYILSDLEERIESNQRDQVVFSGNCVLRHFVVPGRQSGERVADYKMRLKVWRRAVPRGSDSAYRIALAYEALRRAGEKTIVAATIIRDELSEVLARSKAAQSQWAAFGVSHKLIKPLIGRSRRSKRTKRKSRGITPTDRRAAVIRAEASRVIRLNERGFQSRFGMELATYRHYFHRDADWFAEAQAVYRQRVDACQRELGSYHWLTASHTLNLARLLHEQGKFDEAHTVYYDAREKWQGLIQVAETLRRESVALIDAGLEECRNRCPLVHYPPPRVPPAQSP